MGITLEPCDRGKHGDREVAVLIYQADEEFNSMIYGGQEDGVRTIVAMMGMENNYFTPPHILCAVQEGRLIGVINGMFGMEKKELDAATGKDFIKVFGLWSFLRKMPTLFKMQRIVTQQIDDDGFLILNISVDPAYRGQGIGAQMIGLLSQGCKKIYADVNIGNSRALRFYQKVGFRAHGENTADLKGRKVGTYSLIKD